MNNDIINEEHKLIRFYLKLPFNNLLGLNYLTHNDNSITLSFQSQPQFIGNTHKSILHGGVIASAIDAAGGARALLNGLQKMKGLTEEEKMQHLFKSSTIDLRVDFLEPGHGQCFSVNALTLRGGSRLSVIRIDLRNEKETLIASGSATYLIGSP